MQLLATHSSGSSRTEMHCLFLKDLTCIGLPTLQSISFLGGGKMFVCLLAACFGFLCLLLA